MVVEQKSNLSFLGVFPKCPFYKPVLQWVFRLGLMALGTVGLYFLNLWVAVGYLIYSFGFYLWAMPIKHCQYCYLLAFFYICFNFFNWLYSCAGGNVDSYEVESLSNMRYRG